jgi:protein TonB
LKRRWRLLGGSALLLVVLAALVMWLISAYGSGAEVKKKKVIQEIALVKPPPPPPPPKVPPPKVEEVKQKIDVPKPDEAPAKSEQAPPPGPDLAVDAAGSGAGDGFGLVGKKGGADLIGGGGGGTNRFGWYGAMLKDRIQDAIQKDKKLREAGVFQRVVNIWIDASGAVSRVEIIGGSDSAEMNSAIKATLIALAPLREAPPADMPQPIRVRVSAR